MIRLDLFILRKVRLDYGNKGCIYSKKVDLITELHKYKVIAERNNQYRKCWRKSNR